MPIPENKHLKIVDDADGKYFRRPDCIPVNNHLYNLFNHYETEVSAGWLIEFCQERKGWLPFTKAEIDKYAGEDFWFNQLDTLGWIVKEGDTFYFTEAFIDHCYHKIKRSK